MEEKQNSLCPSAPIKKGHLLLGKFIEDDQLNFIEKRTIIDKDLYDEIKKSSKNEYRVSMVCQSKNCINWNGHKCTVPDQMYKYLNNSHFDKIADCSIRSECRWFLQDGYKACKICPLIKTEQYEG